MKGHHVLSLDGVSVNFRHGEKPALVDVTFQIAAGERVALLGLNGSGKSTLLASIAGLVPFSGTITVLQRELNERTVKEIRGDIGFLFSIPEDQILFPKVIDDVAFTLVQQNVPVDEAKERASKVLSRLDAGRLADLAPDELSHGQRLRVALAGAIAAYPPLLLLDEPSSGLDPHGSRALIRYLRSLPSAMLVASHDLSFARRVCDRFILLEEGRIRLEGVDFRDVERYWGLDEDGD